MLCIMLKRYLKKQVFQGLLFCALIDIITIICYHIIIKFKHPRFIAKTKKLGGAIMLSLLLGVFSTGLKTAAMAATAGAAKLTTPIVCKMASVGATALHVASAVPLGVATTMNVFGGKGSGGK